MAKKVFYDDDARRRVLAGAQILYDAVKTTMGPKGRNVVISKSFGAPTVTHDGVTVAKGVEISDVDDETLGYKVGAELIKQAASKMNDVAGDGTTTVTVLTYNILYEANKLIAAGHNPMLLRKGLELATADVLEKLDRLREDIAANKKRIAEVATISAGDATIGELIAGVMDKVGREGVVTVEEGQGLQLESEVVEGFTFDRGFVSSYMVTDTARLEAVYDKPAVIVTDKKIGSIQEFLPILEKLAQTGKKDLVLIAEDVEGEALATLILNRLKGVFNTVAVKAPAFGDRRKEILEDIAILTGATVIGDERGDTFEDAELNMIGSARRIIVGKDAGLQFLRAGGERCKRGLGLIQRRLGCRNDTSDLGIELRIDGSQFAGELDDRRMLWTIHARRGIQLLLEAARVGAQRHQHGGRLCIGRRGVAAGGHQRVISGLGSDHFCLSIKDLAIELGHRLGADEIAVFGR